MAALALIDCHTHVWTHTSPMTAGRHYTPVADQPVQQLLLDQQQYGIARTVLVQPSFLADANHYLVQALAHAPQCLRGVATFEQAPTPQTIRNLHAAGVRGLRYNLFGPTTLPDASAPWTSALQAMRDAGWHAVVAGSGAPLAAALTCLASSGLPLIIDHYAMPSLPDIERCPGVQALQTVSRQSACWIKLSAPYRLNRHRPADVVRVFNELGFRERYLWGSDSPFTRFEAQQSYIKVLSVLQSLIDDELIDVPLLERNAMQLYFDIEKDRITP